MLGWRNRCIMSTSRINLSSKRNDRCPSKSDSTTHSNIEPERQRERALRLLGHQCLREYSSFVQRTEKRTIIERNATHSLTSAY